CLSDHLGAQKHDGPRDEGREGLKMQNADGIDRAGGAGDDQQERKHARVISQIRQCANAPSALALLCTPTHRPSSRCGPEERDEVAAGHSMTLSARTGRVELRPSATGSENPNEKS